MSIMYHHENKESEVYHKHWVDKELGAIPKTQDSYRTIQGPSRLRWIQIIERTPKILLQSIKDSYSQTTFGEIRPNRY